MIKNNTANMMLNLKYTHQIFLLTLFIAVLPYSICISQNKELQKVTFLPSWVPQPQFAGYYMAKEKGIYEKYGLDVTVLNGGFDKEVPELLQTGKTDFGIMLLYTAVMKRAEGVKIVNLGQIFQRSAIMFVAKKKSGIKTLKDFNGKKIGVWRTIALDLTTGFLKIHNINAQIIPFDKGIDVFLKDVVDVTVMMNYNEYKLMINSGINPDEVNVFNFYDYDMNFPEDGIYCMESTLKNDPELCRKFVDASIEGWNYALANEDETIIVMNKYKEMANVFSNKSHSQWMLKSMKDMINSSGKNVNMGNLLINDYEKLINFLFENKFISYKPLYSDFYKGLR